MRPLVLTLDDGDKAVIDCEKVLLAAGSKESGLTIQFKDMTNILCLPVSDAKRCEEIIEEIAKGMGLPQANATQAQSGDVKGEVEK